MKIELYGKEYDSKNVDFIVLDYKLVENRIGANLIDIDCEYCFKICENGRSINIKESLTKNEKVLKKQLENLKEGLSKSTFETLNNYYLINLAKAKEVYIEKSKFLKRKKLVVVYELENGKTYTIRTDDVPNKSDKWDKIVERYKNISFEQTYEEYKEGFCKNSQTSKKTSEYIQKKYGTQEDSEEQKVCPAVQAVKKMLDEESELGNE